MIRNRSCLSKNSLSHLISSQTAWKPGQKLRVALQLQILRTRDFVSSKTNVSFSRAIFTRHTLSLSLSLSPHTHPTQYNAISHNHVKSTEHELKQLSKISVFKKENRSKFFLSHILSVKQQELEGLSFTDAMMQSIGDDKRWPNWQYLTLHTQKNVFFKKELWHQPSAVIQKVWFPPRLLIAEPVLWLWEVVPGNMTYCAFDSLEISTCVRVPFYVTPPHSQPFNMMHICTSTATNPPPPPPSLLLLPPPPPSSLLYSHIRKTHKQAHEKADARTLASARAHARARSHRQHRFVRA